MTVLFKTACGCSKIVDWHGSPDPIIRVALMPKLTANINLIDQCQVQSVRTRTFERVGWRGPYCMEYEEVYGEN